MDLSPYWEANCLFATKEIARHLENQKCNYLIRKKPHPLAVPCPESNETKPKTYHPILWITIYSYSNGGFKDNIF